MRLLALAFTLVDLGQFIWTRDRIYGLECAIFLAAFMVICAVKEA